MTRPTPERLAEIRSEQIIITLMAGICFCFRTWINGLRPEPTRCMECKRKFDLILWDVGGG